MRSLTGRRARDLGDPCDFDVRDDEYEPASLSVDVLGRPPNLLPSGDSSTQWVGGRAKHVGQKRVLSEACLWDGAYDKGR